MVQNKSPKMHHPKPKSAPARLKSKYVKNRTNAMKEIEAWVRKDKDQFSVQEPSRMSGQLTDNVTEERMLKAKLWELSKERYKFLSQSSYEKKVFQDRQQKKNSTRRIASASYDGRQTSLSTDTTPSDGRYTSLGLMTPSTHKSGPKNARFAMLDRLDPTKKKSRSKKVVAASEDDVTASQKLDPGEGARPKKSERKPSPAAGDCSPSPTSRRRTLSVTKKIKPAESYPHHDLRHTAPTFLETQDTGRSLGHVTIDKHSECISSTSSFDQNNSYRPEASPAIKVHTASSSRTAEPAEYAEQELEIDDCTSTAAWHKKPPKQEKILGRYGMPIETLTTDNRFQILERTLCPLTRSSTEEDVHGIVSSIESLHVRPKKRLPDAPKSKIEVKAYEFMKEKGFVFG